MNEVISTDESALLDPAQYLISTLHREPARKFMISVLREFAKFHGQSDWSTYPWCDLSHSAFSDYKSSLINRKLSPSTANLRLAAIRQVAKHAWMMGLMTIDDYLAISRVENFPKHKVAPSLANGYVVQLRNNAIYALFKQGLDSSDIATLTLQQVDLVNKALILANNQCVSLSDAVWGALERWLAFRGEKGYPSVFLPTIRGEKLAYNRPLSRSAIMHTLSIYERVGAWETINKSES